MRGQLPSSTSSRRTGSVAPHLGARHGTARRHVARHVVFSVVLVALAVGWLPAASPAMAAPGGSSPAGAHSGAALPPHEAGVVLVGFKPRTTQADRAAVRASVSVRAAAPLSWLAPDSEKWTLPAGAGVDRVIAALLANPNVRFAEPNYLVTTGDTSNDPSYTNGSLWGMYGDGTTPANAFGSQAGEAWAAGRIGSSNVYVGVIDEGIQHTHPDLSANVWTNPFDAAGDGVDNDGNGYVDDTNGWDFHNNDRTIFDGSDNHGTHVSGTIGGVGGNGIGVAGVNWHVTLISGKFLGPNGGNIANAVKAVDYFTDLKARHGLNIVATNNSWGGGGYSQAMLDAIERGGDAGILFVAAAGNSNTNNDTTASYPSGYQCIKGGTRGWDCVVAVAAIDSAGNKASFTSYGATTVDLSAPGVGILSTVATDSYASYNGTSMATPHVSGAVALCASINTGLSALALRNAVMLSTAPTASMASITVSGGRLDIGSMVGRCTPSTAAPTGSPSSLLATSQGTDRIALTWVDGVSGETGYEVQRASRTAGTCGTWGTVARLPENSTAFTVTGLAASTDHCFRVRGTNGFNGGSASSWSNTAVAATDPVPPPYECSNAAYAWIDATSSGGTRHSLGDDTTELLTLPFAFSAYGVPYTQATLSANGFLRLGSGLATQAGNVAIPNTADPNGIIAPAWDDWNPGAGGAVWTRMTGTAPNRQFVASWINVPHYRVTGSNGVTFQLVLEEGGAVRFQYLDTIVGHSSYDRGRSATVGIENATGQAGTQISYNTISLSDATAYRCSTPAAPIAPTISGSPLPDGTTGIAYSSGFTASGGVSPYTWSITSGSLPAGLLLSSSAGAITGTPTTTGTASFTVQATGADGGTSTRSTSIRVAAPLAISTTSLAAGTVGTSYSAALASTGGEPAITWSLASGSLPSGLTLSSSGSISGTPSASGTYGFTVLATDSGSPVRTATKSLSIEIAAGTTVGTATVVTYTGPTSTTASTSITLSATLKTSGGTAISGKVLTFTLNGDVRTATTNNKGVASVGVTSPATNGSYTIGVTFAGDATYAASSTSATLSVKSGTVLTYTGTASAAKGSPITLSATLKTSTGAGIQGAQVTFTLNRKTYTAITDSSGVATVSQTAPTKAGTYTVSVKYAGNATYAASSTSGSLTVL
jgi:subtilisin family serine protease